MLKPVYKVINVVVDGSIGAYAVTVIKWRLKLNIIEIINIIIEPYVSPMTLVNIVDGAFCSEKAGIPDTRI